MINDKCQTQQENAVNDERQMQQEILVSWLVFWAESTTEDYITAKNNVQSVFYLLCTQVIKTQITQKTQNQSWYKFTWNKTYTNIKHKIFEE